MEPCIEVKRGCRKDRVQAGAIDIEEDGLSQGAEAPSAGDSERAGTLEHVRS